MNYNVGALDRTLRILLGGIGLAAAAMIEREFRWWSVVCMLPLLTGVVGFCPLYALLGINTCRDRASHTR